VCVYAASRLQSYVDWPRRQRANIGLVAHLSQMAGPSRDTCVPKASFRGLF